MSPGRVFVLIHSPLVGPSTWTQVAEEMQARGLAVLVPKLQDSSLSTDLFWRQHAESVARDINEIPQDTGLILIAHSGAGPLLPAIGGSVLHPVRAYVFVDAGIPRDGASRLDLMRSEDPEWAAQFQKQLERGERFPTWSFEDLRDVIPDLASSKQTVAELRPRRLDFFIEPIPVFEGWPDAPCVYIQFSVPYKKAAQQARKKGWIVEEIEAGHFHMLVDPSTVTAMIVEAVSKSQVQLWSQPACWRIR